MNKAFSRDVLKKIKQTKVLVLGDVLLDLYVRGDVHRISPEAPVPIMLETSREYSLGGAGNVANNIASVGGRVSLVSAVGRDKEADIVRRICAKNSVRFRFVSESRRHTPLKMRAVAGQHQLLRVDREHVREISEASRKKLFQMIKNIPDHHFIVLSDYVKGFVTKDVVEALKKRFGSGRIIANIKPSSKIGNYKNVGVITMNAKEGYDLTGMYGDTDHATAQALRRLARLFSASVVMTRSEKGMSVYNNVTKKISHISSPALHVFDVTGAGDTVVALLGLMLGTGMPLEMSAEIANRAAGVVVGMPGTAVLRPQDFKNILRGNA